MMMDYTLQGIVCSGIAYFVQGIVMKERGPVFVTAFNPLCMVIVAVLGSLILFEEIHLGRYQISTSLLSLARHLRCNLSSQAGWV